MLRPEEAVTPGEGYDTLALTAFTLTTLRDPLLRKDQIKQMWASGADFMVRTTYTNRVDLIQLSSCR